MVSRHRLSTRSLVVRVVHGVLALPLPCAVALEAAGDVECGVHPAVGLQRALAHPASGLRQGVIGKQIKLNL